MEVNGKNMSSSELELASLTADIVAAYVANNVIGELIPVVEVARMPKRANADEVPMPTLPLLLILKMSPSFAPVPLAQMLVMPK